LRLAAPSRGGVSGENLLDSAPSDDPPVIDSVIAREQSALLHQGIARLPECQRAVVLLYVLYDKDYARIAQAVNRTVETVRGNMHQALKNLRRILHGMQQDVEGQVDCERQTH
jgi:RNA polymerase sigma factor (sigma-70 family)